ncbi:hypothetical protein NIES4071_93560 [Calothrix sp. NIES-4071]|nr:hypothetical protein NIES4071_93560 [Calothrix sp. NIES-4071]BAZ63621.1 hypothetical protein NIES4105_93490 [Calothrix sp. NIES-4105]
MARMNVSVLMKKKKPSLALTLSSAGLLIGGGIAGYWLLTQGRPLSRYLPPGATIIPSYALFTVSMTTDVKQWQQLREFGTSVVQAEIDKNIVQVRDRFLTNNGYDFQKDIQPWVGEEVTLAVLAPADNSKPPAKPVASGVRDTSSQQLVLVLPIKNPQNAKNILTQIKARKGSEFKETTYKGIPIKQTDSNSINSSNSSSGSNTQDFAVSVIEDKYVVITDSSVAMEKVIDASQTKTSLSTVPGYAENISKISTYQPFAQFYINVPTSAKIASAAPNRQLPTQVLSQLQNNQGLAGTITLDTEGVRIKGISWLNPNSQRVLTVDNNAGEMQNRIPAETLMMLSGGNLARVWADYTLTSQANPLSPMPPEQLRSGFKSLTNMDLDRDLISWMNGEFSLSVIPTSKEGSDEAFRAALVFMIQTNNRASADAALKQLDEVMRSQYQFRIEEKKAFGHPVINWIGPFGTLTASHGWMDDDVAFIALGAPITEKILSTSQSNNSLARAEAFQKAVPSELNPTNGQFFLDVERTSKNFPLPPLFPNQQTFLDATRSIGITSAVNDNRSNRYDIFISLKKAGKMH